MSNSSTVCLNRFPVYHLNEEACTVHQYSYTFSEPPEGPDIYRAVGSIIYKIGAAVGTRLEDKIVVTEPISTNYLQGDNWTLNYVDKRVLDPAVSVERKALEQLRRRHFYLSVKRARNKPMERSGSGYILWDDDKIEGSGKGWQVLRGAVIDVSVDEDGLFSLEIDSHYRFYSPWTVQQWLDEYPGIPLSYVHNIKGGYSWRFVETSSDNPEEVTLKGLGQTLADYHRSQGVSDSTIQDSTVVYLRHLRKGQRDELTPHLSQLIKPSVSMEILSDVAERGDKTAAKMLTAVRIPIRERLLKGLNIAEKFITGLYGKNCDGLQPQRRSATQFKAQRLIARNGTVVSRPEAVIEKGCLQVGETKFGCLLLQQTAGDWPETVSQQLMKVASTSGVTVDLAHLQYSNELPDSDMERRLFWNAIAQKDIKTMLVVSQMLGKRKSRLRGEALRAGIALQFMRPMPNPERYRGANVTLGLLMKAGWQTVGMNMPNHPQAAELVIGFDAGTDRKLFYGTSAFAVLASGQSLGWEIPEAQAGERFSSRAIWDATLSIVGRFNDLNGRRPKSILLLRDGIVRDREFDLTIQELEKEGIAVDLLEVHKSGAGRIARLVDVSGTERYEDVIPGTGFSISNDAFRIVTSKAKSGSARPLEVVKLHGDAPLRLLANEIFSLSQFHPASAFTPSRLPMPLHYADKMIKEVQRIGSLGVLSGVDRRKLFAV